MKDKIVVISGANSGIGKQTALQIAKMGAHVILICRNAQRGQHAMQEIIDESGNQKVDLMLCDLASQESIKHMSEYFYDNYSHIDVLINNAGAIFGKRQLSPEGLERTFALNHMGYFLLTHHLLDALKQGEMKRIVNVASLAHKMVRKLDWDNVQGEKSYAQLYNYGLSKLFNIYFTKELARRLDNEGFTVNCLHPGTVSTGFGSSASGFFKRLVDVGRRFLMSPVKGAATSVHLATSLEVEEVTGEYFVRKKVAKITKLAQDEQHAKKLWELSMKLGKIEAFGYPG